MMMMNGRKAAPAAVADFWTWMRFKGKTNMTTPSAA